MAGSGERERVLDGCCVHRLVKGNCDRLRRGDKLKAVDGRHLDDARNLGGKRPGIVLGKQPACGIRQPGTDRCLVRRRGCETIVWAKDIDRGVEPFARARNRRVQDQRIGEILCRIDRDQWDHGPVKHHRYRAVHVDSGCFWRRLDLCHFQVAGGGKTKGQILAQGDALLALGRGGNRHPVDGLSFPGLVRSKDQDAIVGPLKITLNHGLDGKRTLYARAIHGLVKSEH